MLSQRVRIRDCSGINSGQTGTILPWTDKAVQGLAREYPFVGGRTPYSMKWVAVQLDNGQLDSFPKNRVTALG